MIQNHLTARQLDNFTRRARFTVCGEPCDVFADTDYDAMQFVTVNHDGSGNSWLEATAYHRYTIDATEEVSPDFIATLGKAAPEFAREVIVKELRRWASYPADTVTGYTPEDIAAEADRIARG